MADFQETARAKLRELSSKKASVRREAAYYLGEAGVDEAITRLATIYKSDPDKSVREAAAYALGQFRAVEQALNRGEEEKVIRLLTGIVEDGKMGRRLKMPRSALVRLELFLLILFIVLAAANFLFLPNLRAALGRTPAPTRAAVANADDGRVTDRAALVGEIRASFEKIRNDGANLQGQFQQVLTGGQLDCAAFFNGTAPFTLSAADASAYPDLAATVSTLNAAETQVAAAKNRYEQACFENQPLETAQVGGVLAPLVEALNSLADIEAALNAALTTALPSQPTVAPTANIPAATAAPTEAFTFALTEAVQLADPRRHLSPLYSIIDSMTAPRGGNGLLKQYWLDVQQAGRTDGCDSTRPPIPGNYDLPEADAQTSPELAQAVEQINIGLAHVRDGWALFDQGCNTNSLTVRATTGAQLSENAEQAFENADILLNAVRNAVS